MPWCTVWRREASHCCTLAPILSPVVFVTVAFLSVDCREHVCSAEFINITRLYPLYLGILSRAASHTCKHWPASLVFVIINLDWFYCSCHFPSCTFRSYVFAKSKRTVRLPGDAKIIMIATSRSMSNLSFAFDPSHPVGALDISRAPKPRSNPKPSCKQKGSRNHFYNLLVWPWQGINPSTSQSRGGHYYNSVMNEQ